MVIPPPTTNAEFGLQNKNSASERINASRAATQRVSSNNQTVSATNNDSSATFGLGDRNSTAERIASLRDTQQRVDSNISNFRNTSNDSSAEFGLQDRNTFTERSGTIEQLNQRLVENHGFEAKKYTRDALANNTKIINIPVLERGSLVDIKA